MHTCEILRNKGESKKILLKNESVEPSVREGDRMTCVHKLIPSRLADMRMVHCGYHRAILFINFVTNQTLLLILEFGT